MLVRIFKKDDLDKWVESVTKDDVCMSDALMTLSTTGNELSFWDLKEEEMGQAVIAWTSNRDKTVGVFVVSIEDKIKDEIEHNSEEGQTVIEDLKSKHVNLINLNYEKLGVLAREFTSCIKDVKYKYFSDSDIKKLFYDAIESNRLNVNNLQIKLKNKLLEGKRIYDKEMLSGK